MHTELRYMLVHGELDGHIDVQNRAKDDDEKIFYFLWYFFSERNTMNEFVGIARKHSVILLETHKWKKKQN